MRARSAEHPSTPGILSPEPSSSSGSSSLKKGTPAKSPDGFEEPMIVFSLPIDGALLVKALRPVARAAAEKEKKQARKAERHAERLAHIPNPDAVEIDNDKLDNYALNALHPEGKNKSVVLRRAGFKLVQAFQRGAPEVGRAAANADPEYLASRDALKKQLTSNLAQTPADPMHNPYGKRYDTKHMVVNSQIDNAQAAVVKVQWIYDMKNGEPSDKGRLVSVQPSQLSSDSEQE